MWPERMEAVLYAIQYIPPMNGGELMNECMWEF